jgi:hypothetical protein
MPLREPKERGKESAVKQKKEGCSHKRRNTLSLLQIRNHVFFHL